MSKYTQKRKRIFDVYSKNWLLFSKYLRLPESWKGIPIYVCPICMRAFDESGLDQSLEYKLTLEDVPPKTLGGKPIILTCNSCNNTSGFELDSHLLNQTKALNVLSRKLGGKKRVEFQINDKSRIRGEIENLASETIKIRFDKTKNPYAQKDIEYLFKNWNNGKITVKIQGGNLQRLEIAKLRIAYLLAFAKFGYGFVLNHTMNPIREQILNPDKNILKHSGVVKPNFDQELEGIFIIKEPKELISYLVIYNIIESGHKSKISVILPSPNPSSFSIYDRMSTIKVESKITFDSIPNLDYLSNKEVIRAPLELWNKFTTESNL